MGKLAFGWDDKITCIQSVELKGQGSEPLCLAYKTSKLFLGAQRALTKRPQSRDALIPVSFGPPQVVTEGDRFIAHTVTAMVQPGEKLQHQAFALRDAEELSHVYFAALTSSRLILISSKRKFRGLVLENGGVTEVPRAQIADVTESSYELTIKLTTGGQFPLIVPKAEKEFSNQRAFVRDLPRLLAAEKSVGPMVQVA